MPQKKLTVEFDGKRAPKYEFEGEWNGRDVIIVRRTIRRAYKLHQVSLQKKLKEETENGRRREDESTSDGGTAKSAANSRRSGRKSGASRGEKANRGVDKKA